jgi:hypothetical protein
MLICFNCEEELKKEYQDRLKKENKPKYHQEMHHSKIRRKLIDNDNLSQKSFYTDNNSYRWFDRGEKNNTEDIHKRSKINRNDEKNIIRNNIDDDKISKDNSDALSYHSVFTDYSYYRKKKNKKINKNVQNNINNKTGQEKDQKGNNINNDNGESEEPRDGDEEKIYIGNDSQKFKKENKNKKKSGEKMKFKDNNEAMENNTKYSEIQDNSKNNKIDYNNAYPISKEKSKSSDSECRNDDNLKFVDSKNHKLNQNDEIIGREEKESDKIQYHKKDHTERNKSKKREENHQDNKYEICKNKDDVLYRDYYYREVSFGSSISSGSQKNSISSNSKNIKNEETGNNKPFDYNSNINCKGPKLPYDTFSNYILQNINKIRTNPKSFIPKLESCMKNVKLNRKNKYFYQGKQNIALNNGIYAFENAIKHLKNMREMNELIYRTDLNINLPKNVQEINDIKYEYREIKKMIDNNMIIYSYWREIISDPEDCLILMIVDDCGSNYGQKRKDLLNPKMKYIGINSVQIQNSFSCYIILSDI